MQSNESNYSGNGIEKQPGISYLTGFLGALIGVLVGVIPWFLVTTFTNWFVGWLGFLVAFCAFFGYKLFRGAKNKWYAMIIIILLTLIGIVLSDFAGNMYELCKDSEWIEYANYFGVSVQSLAFEAITAPENLTSILPNLGIGLLIGMLGAISIRRNVNEYVGIHMQTFVPNELPLDNTTENTTNQSKDNDYII